MDGARPNDLLFECDDNLLQVKNWDDTEVKGSTVLWAPDQPDCTCDDCPVAELCLEIRHNGIHDASCKGNKPYLCMLDVDECQLGTDDCGSYANMECVNTFGSYTCECSEGWVADGPRSCVSATPTATLSPTKTPSKTWSLTPTETPSTLPDSNPPVAKCKDFLHILLNANGRATLAATDIDDGSYDAESGIKEMTATPTDLWCTDVDPAGLTGTLTVTDYKGNQAICTTTVIVQDAFKPKARCKEMVVRSRMDITIDSIAGESSDECGLAVLALSSVSDVPGHSNQLQVSVKVFDSAFNEATCSAIVHLMSDTPTNTLSETVTARQTLTPTVTSSQTRTMSSTVSHSSTVTLTTTNSPSLSRSSTSTSSGTLTLSKSPTYTPTLTATPTPTETQTPSLTQTHSESETKTRSPSPTATYSITSTRKTTTYTPSPTATPTNTPEVSLTPTARATPTPEATPTIKDLAEFILRINADKAGQAAPKDTPWEASWWLLAIICGGSVLLCIILVVLLVILIRCNRQRKFWVRHGHHQIPTQFMAVKNRGETQFRAGMDVMSSMDSQTSATGPQANTLSFQPFTPVDFTAVVPRSHGRRNGNVDPPRTNPLVSRVNRESLLPELQEIRGVVVQSFMGLIHDEENAFPVSVDQTMWEIQDNWERRGQDTKLGFGVKVLATVSVYSSQRLKVGKTMNLALYNSNNAQAGQFRPFLEFVTDCLRQLPVYTGTVYKGVTSTLTLQDGYRRGSCVSAAECLDSTFYGSVALQTALCGNNYTLGGCTVFIIESLHGKNVSGCSPAPGEIEVVFPPGTKFEVMRAVTQSTEKCELLLGSPEGLSGEFSNIDWSCVFVYILRERWDMYAPPPHSAATGTGPLSARGGGTGLTPFSATLNSTTTGMMNQTTTSTIFSNASSPSTTTMNLANTGW
eukprot:TRINITY_DN68205_c5_g3_i2.p1 TRINITY_DN68205_c5_g3~~TRINITY_DN68205_c5_g3_i2.p1  ORF type:complete len:991 (-),score=59.90 TRINITY_DN68205_c5_g3_i2:735-3491(-)